MPVGKRGEICVRGPQVMTGYWNRPEETTTAFQGGRLHTGDVGYIDEDGYIFLIDRIKDLILNAGFNVYPRMVEEAIHLHPRSRKPWSAACPTRSAARSSRPMSSCATARR